MSRKRWNEGNITQEALKYKTRGEFQKESSGAAKAAKRLNIHDKVCSHMLPRVPYLLGSDHPKFKWSFEKLQMEALKYDTKNNFRKKNPSAYNIALRLKILDKICKHMPIYTRTGANNPNFVWTYENLKNEALKYQTKPEFRKNNRGAWEACKRRKILNELCLHMKKLQRRWSELELFEEAKKYGSKSEFESKNLGGYESARRKKILNSVCSHMKRQSQSPQEKELMSMILKAFPSARSFMDRKVDIPNKPHIKGFEIDIFIPELRKGIEFDGTWIHSFRGLKRSRPHWPEEDIKNYHKIKDRWFKSKGIQILHIKERQWIKDKKNCLNRCLEFLKNND